MARKFGKVNRLKVDMRNYDYIINGTGGIGKTDLAVKLGKIITGSDEGTFVLTMGLEPKPEHIDGAFGDYAEDWKGIDAIATDLIDNRVEYKNTVWIAFDSLDELFRLAELETVRIWNKKNPNDKAESVSQAFKGFQKGENYSLGLVLELRQRLRLAGYHFIDLGHTKEKGKTDLIQGIEFKQYTNKLDAKYYDSIKDKSAIACVAYDENEIADVQEVRDAFTKGKKKVGNLIGRKRVICFRDDDFSCDTKSYFKHIVSKIDFSVEGFIKAIEDAIKAELEEVSGKEVSAAEIKKLAEEQHVEHEQVESLAEKAKEAEETQTRTKDDIMKELQKLLESDESLVSKAMAKLKELGIANFVVANEEQLEEILKDIK